MRTGVSLTLGWLLLMAGPALGATITSEFLKGNDLHLIVIDGQLQFGDEKKFADLAIKVPDAIVAFGSDGGNLHAGMEIGRIIRMKGYSTVVPDEIRCASACALAWLGGRVRAMASTARVGFHAGYRLEGGKPKEDGAANALVGAYLYSLGLSQSFIIYATRTPPESMQWLSFKDASKLGLDVRQFDFAAAPPPSPAQPGDPPSRIPARLPDPPSPSPAVSPAPDQAGSPPPGRKEATAPPLDLAPVKPLTLEVSPSTEGEPLLDLTRMASAHTVQTQLNARGFLQTPILDGVWGPRSRIALRDFKTWNGLPFNDAWDLPTQLALFNPRSKPAPSDYRPPDPLTATVGLNTLFTPSPGMRLHPLNPAEANIIQRRLAELGYYRILPEGIWGSASRSALRDFKVAHGLPADDTWDYQTEAALGSEKAVHASSTPFGEWAVVGYPCTTSPSPYRMAVSSRDVRIGSLTCEVTPALTRSGADWSGDAECYLNGRRIASRIALSVSGQTLIDRSVIGLPAGTSMLNRCPAG